MTPDKKTLTSVTYSVKKSKNNTEEIPGKLLAAWQAFSQTTGITLDGAEELIEKVTTLEEEEKINNDSYSLRVSYKNRASFRLDPLGDYEVLPYSPDDVYQYLETVDKPNTYIYRNIQYGDFSSWEAEEPQFELELELDGGERIYSAEFIYSGSDEAEKKAGFEAFADFFLKGAVREETESLLEEFFKDKDAYWDNHKNGVQKIDSGYTISFKFQASAYHFIIEVEPGRIPEDAKVFPSAAEQAELVLDPLARVGADPTVKLPETVIYDENGIKIILKDSDYYVRSSDVDFRINFESSGLKDGMRASIQIQAINGIDLVEYDLLEYARLDEEEKEDYAEFSMVELKKNLPDYNGITSVTLRVDILKGELATDEKVVTVEMGK